MYSPHSISPIVVKTPNDDGQYVEEEGEESITRSFQQSLKILAQSTVCLPEYRTNCYPKQHVRTTKSRIQRTNDVSEFEEMSCSGAISRDDLKSQFRFSYRALFIGVGLGLVFAAQNLYFSFRSGASIAGTLSSFFVVTWLTQTLTWALRRLLACREFSVHEQVIIQSALKATQSIVFIGGFSTYVLGMSEEVSALSLQVDVSHSVSYVEALVWPCCLYGFGLCISEAFFRINMIPSSTLPWMEATASGNLLRSLHCIQSKGSGLGLERISQMLNFFMKVTASAYIWYVFKWVYNGFWLMEKWPVFGTAAASFAWTMDWSTAFVGSGVLMPAKSVCSMLSGTIVMFAIIAPVVNEASETSASPSTWSNLAFGTVEKSAWLGSLMAVKAYWFLPSLAIIMTDSFCHAVKAGVLYIKYVRSRKASSGEPVELSRDEEEPHSNCSRDVAASENASQLQAEPPSTSPTFSLAKTSLSHGAKRLYITIGAVVSAVCLCFSGSFLLGISWYTLLIAVAVVPFFGYALSVASALTSVDLTPLLGKCFVIIFSPWTKDPQRGMWLAGLVMGASYVISFRLQDYHTSRLTLTHSRHVLIAHIFGGLIGVLITPGLYFFMKNAFMFEQQGNFTAPEAVAFRTLADIFATGFSLLPRNVGRFVICASLWTIINNVLEEALPEKFARFLPSCLSFGLGGFVAPVFGINALLGFGTVQVWSYLNPNNAQIFSPVLGAGMILGEGLGGITSAILKILGAERPMGMAVRFGPPFG